MGMPINEEMLLEIHNISVLYLVEKKEHTLTSYFLRCHRCSLKQIKKKKAKQNKL